MGCNSSKHDKEGRTKKSNSLLRNTNKPLTNMKSGDLNNVDFEQDWVNAIKNENVKEGSLINPPDDLAKDTKLEVILNHE